MGITRFTQDLRPYLERCIVGCQAKDDSEIRIVSLVIDGPSMVYNVYNKLVAYASTAGNPVDLFALPGYAQLNAAVQSFLCDLELCGAKM